MIDSRVSARALRFAVIVAALLLLPPGAGAETAWLLSAESVFPGGEPANAHVASVLERLEGAEGAGVAVSATEFRAWCDVAGPAIDRKALLRYAVPGSIGKQNHDHAEYAKVLMGEDRLDAGSAFLREHGPLLRAAESRYGVARQDIVAILMWESALGRITGRTRVFNVLVAQLLYLEVAREAAIADFSADGTWDPALDMAADERERRFEKLRRRAATNLVALLRLSKAKGQDPTAQLGSWAGAIGYPQFMPASLAHAVDGDGDGVIDLNTWPDAIFSVASYLHAHRYTTSYAGRKRGIHAYNPINSYVHGVIRYADAIARR